ncbi:hypothetical protein EDF48_103364 [Curtobacterium sp. PhB191]|nr:hypothetical protein EDF48_103364 [Curtobacterium sp. PhB191]
MVSGGATTSMTSSPAGSNTNSDCSGGMAPERARTRSEFATASALSSRSRYMASLANMNAARAAKSCTSQPSGQFIDARRFSTAWTPSASSSASRSSADGSSMPYSCARSRDSAGFTAKSSSENRTYVRSLGPGAASSAGTSRSGLRRVSPAPSTHRSSPSATYRMRRPLSMNSRLDAAARFRRARSTSRCVLSVNRCPRCCSKSNSRSCSSTAPSTSDVASSSSSATDPALRSSARVPSVNVRLSAAINSKTSAAECLEYSIVDDRVGR